MSLTGIKEAVIRGQYRYMLSRQWGEPDFLNWMMLNPSIADANFDDPTVRRVAGFSKEFGYGGCRILNLFALRSSSPKDLLTSNNPVGPLNDEYISEYVNKGRTIVCAWGALNSKLKWRVNEVVGNIIEKTSLYCLGMTKNKSPKHPLYLRKDSELRLLAKKRRRRIGGTRIKLAKMLNEAFNEKYPNRNVNIGPNDIHPNQGYWSHKAQDVMSWEGSVNISPLSKNSTDMSLVFCSWRNMTDLVKKGIILTEDSHYSWEVDCDE